MRLGRIFGARKNVGLDLKVVNLCLVLAIALLGFYLATNVSASVKEIAQAHVDGGNLARTRLAKESAVLKESDFYLESIRERDIFRMGPKKAADKIDEVVSSAAVEATRFLKLVGISWSDNPDAIIEDERTKQTYFVKKGGMVGDVRVQSVFRDKVILQVGQEAIELR